MSTLLLLEQALNGLQLGVMLFLMAAGLTLVCGIMNLVNLAHGSLYMTGAFLAATFTAWTGSFWLALLLALPATALVGLAVERIAVSRLYDRDHLDQVLATFGLILFFNELTRIVWGPQPLFLSPPEALQGFAEIIPGAPYPLYRLFILAVGLAVAGGLYGLIAHTRLGMLIRAGASNREMVQALGVNIRLLYAGVFTFGAVLAGLGGMLAAPLLSVEIGMGESILILAFVVVIIGGVGSVRGALLGAIAVGVVDTFGRVLLPPAVAEMAIYILMALVLSWRPRGLFPARG
jgi:branched-chain amino acid transport system permease protein